MGAGHIRGSPSVTFTAVIAWNCPSIPPVWVQVLPAPEGSELNRGFDADHFSAAGQRDELDEGEAVFSCQVFPPSVSVGALRG